MKSPMDGDKPVALLVEDDRGIRRSVQTSLATTGWRVCEAGTLAQGVADARATRFDLFVVDLGLPDGDGIDLIAEVRKRSSVPIIVLSARSEEQQKVRALDAGADDYVEKPFRVAEFLARVRAHLRRQGTAGGAEPAGTVVVGSIELDARARTVRKSGVEVHLTPIQFKLFAHLVGNAGRVLTHRQLLREVWGPGQVEHNHYLRVFMASLRQKLEDDPAQPKLIITETGVGYRLVAG